MAVVLGRLGGRDERPVRSRAAIVGPPGSDEAPVYRAVLQASAEPRGDEGRESTRDFHHGLLVPCAGGGWDLDHPTEHDLRFGVCENVGEL